MRRLCSDNLKRGILGLILFLSLLLPVWNAEALTANSLGLDFVDIQALDASIILDIRYATPNNFTGQVLYPSARCLLRESVAYRLLQAQRNLRVQGLGLKLFDCYRPIEVQKKMWAIFPDANYVANPATGGSRHNRGTAVDVGLVNASGTELRMPSAFDEFSERSHLDYLAAEPEAIKNRQILQDAMRRAGFTPVQTEWWHFDDPGWTNYAPANMDPRLVPAGALQVLAVLEPKTGSVDSVLVGFEKKQTGWQRVIGPVPVTVGRSGIAEFEQKREGDGKTPRGSFPLKLVFGYADSEDTRMPYRQATEQDVWIDDPSSPLYNQWVKGIPATESHERMKREDSLYRLGIVIGYNMEPIRAGYGSAIFMHIWQGPGKSTAGCVAMAEEELRKITAWLDPEKVPQIILGVPGVN